MDHQIADFGVGFGRNGLHEDRQRWIRYGPGDRLDPLPKPGEFLRSQPKSIRCLCNAD